MRLFAVPISTFLFYKSRDKISFKGEGCDTPSVTVGATVFYGASTMHLGLMSNSNSNPSISSL
jgi:hypothetical protein